MTPKLDKDQFVSAIQLPVYQRGRAMGAGLHAFGILDASMLLLSTATTIPITVGMAIGQELRRRVNDRRFSSTGPSRPRPRRRDIAMAGLELVPALRKNRIRPF